jgi:amidase
VSADAEFAKALRWLKLNARKIAQFFEEYDVLLTPTLALPPLEIGTLQPKRGEAMILNVLNRANAGSLINALAGVDALAQKVYAFMPYTPVFNVTGQPAMSVPLHWNGDGLPIGMHFVGRYGDEATLFRLAGQLEEAKPWAARVPPICS